MPAQNRPRPPFNGNLAPVRDGLTSWRPLLRSISSEKTFAAALERSPHASLCGL